MNRFDLIVIGAGHAGIEASLAAARLGMNTALLTFDQSGIGRMSCNPAVGGVAKGQLVREIDALGGAMGRIADRAGIQFRMLNTSKGPAVWGPRAQQDLVLYPKIAGEFVAATRGITLIEDEALAFEREERGFSVQLRRQTLSADAVVITSGTFLNARMYTGMEPTVGGRRGEPSATALSESLRHHGIALRRLKTGTPMRLDARSLDFDRLIPQQGDGEPFPFSLMTTTELRNDALCWIARTNQTTHQILRSAFDRSPLLTGSITGLGPRYCPGIEDKLTRFPERTSHQLFAEPEDSACSRIYLNGFNSCFPAEVQEEAVRTITGFERAKVLVPGYDIEYDAIRATDLRATLESKQIPGLYFAGQVNGTSGYEEAAAQGLIAGANAALKLLGKEPLLLGRSEAYTGVLIDDITTLAIPEPYRLFTSRAEYRLLLRQDNTEARLLEKGARLGLVSKEHHARYEEGRARLQEARSALKKTVLKPEVINPILTARGEAPISLPTAAITFLQRGEAPVDELLELAEVTAPLTRQEKTELWGDALYAAYYRRQESELSLREELEKLSISADFDYGQVKNLSAEGREVLHNSRPLTAAQAQRIAGVRATDLAALVRYLRSC